MNSKFKKEMLFMPIPEPKGAVGAGVYNGNKDLAQNGYDGVSGTVTLQSIEDVAPGVLEQDLDKSLIQVRPYDNPVDTIVRELGNVEYINSMEPLVGSDGTIPIIDETSEDVTLVQKGEPVNIKVKNINMWIKHNTFILNDRNSTLVGFYIYDIEITSKTLKCIQVVDAPSGVTTIPANSKLQRISTAVNERQAMIDANELLPNTRSNYCQIFMKTISVGTLALMHRKKLDVTFDSFKERDIWDYRREVESAFTWGVGGKIADVGDKNKTIYMCKGLWKQLDDANIYTCASTMDDKAFISLTEQAFAYDNGSNTKILLAGHGLISKLLEGASYQRTMEQGNTQIVAGIKFHRIETSHGTLLIKPHHLFKENHRFDGMILDPSYITKKYFHKTSTDKMDLLTAGIDRSKSETLWEISTIFANNLPTHTKIIGNPNW